MADLRDKVFRKKLLYDGHGTNEERKIVQLVSDVAKLYLGNLAEDEFQKLYSTASKNLNAVLANADKALKISDRCDIDVGNIEQAIQLKEQEIARVKSELADLHLELEYVDKLKKISVYPDCPTTEAAIKDVMRRKEKLMNQVKKYRQHIVTILGSCKELRQVLDDDQELSGDSDDNDDDEKRDNSESTRDIVVGMDLDRNSTITGLI